MTTTIAERDSSLSLDRVRERLITEAYPQWDATVALGDICLHNGRLLFPEARSDERGFEQGLSLSPWATGQLCERLGIPAEFYRRNPIHLQDGLVNYWMGVKREASDKGDAIPWLIRAKGGTARAILSYRYSVLDNLPLLDALLPLLPPNRYLVKLCSMTGEAWHLRVIDKTLVREAQSGDPLYLGFDLVNSEVGFYACTLSACIYRQVCSNGLTRQIAGTGLLRVRHCGKEPILRLAGRLESALSEAVLVGAAFLEQALLTIRIPVPNAEAAITAVMESWRLPQSVAEMAKWVLLREKPEGSLFALVNALTQSAQSLSLSERLRVETLTATLIDAAVTGPGIGTGISSVEAALARRVLSGK